MWCVQVDGFAKQFDLGEGYHKIADAHHMEKKAVAEAAAAAGDKPSEF